MASGNASLSSVGSSSRLSDRFIKLIFGLLGVGILLPWNAFVSAKPYFQARLCSDGSNSRFGNNIELWFGVVYNLSSVFSLGLLVFLQWYKDHSLATATYESPGELEASEDSSSLETYEENFSSSKDRTYWMIMIPLSVYVVVFFLTTLLVLLPSVPIVFFFGFTIVGLSVCGICTAYASAGIVGTAGLFPPSIGINPYFSGQAVGGVTVALANFIAAALADPSPFREVHCSSNGRQQWTEMNVNDEPASCVPYNEISWATFSYFLLGSFVLATCILGYRYIDHYQRMGCCSSYESLASNNSAGNIDLVNESDRGSIELAPDHDGLVAPTNTMSTKVWQGERHEHDSSVSLVLHALKAPTFSIFMVFFVTLALFPGWTSQLQSVHECHTSIRLANDLYTPLTFVAFNIGDLCGRIVSGSIRLDGIYNVSGKLVVFSLLRLLFFPLFLLCMARDSVYGGLALRSDLFSLVVQSTFGVSNGMVTTLSFMHAPTLIAPLAKTQTRASEILNLALSLGLLCGSVTSFPFTRVATGHW